MYNFLAEGIISMVHCALKGSFLWRQGGNIVISPESKSGSIDSCHASMVLSVALHIHMMSNIVSYHVYMTDSLAFNQDGKK